MIVTCDACGKVAGTGERADAPGDWAVYGVGQDAEVGICVCSPECLMARVQAIGEMCRAVRSLVKWEPLN